MSRLPLAVSDAYRVVRRPPPDRLYLTISRRPAIVINGTPVTHPVPPGWTGPANPNNYEWGYAIAPADFPFQAPTPGTYWHVQLDQGRWINQQVNTRDIQRRPPRLILRVLIARVGAESDSVRHHLLAERVDQNSPSRDFEWAEGAFHRLVNLHWSGAGCRRPALRLMFTDWAYIIGNVLLEVEAMYNNGYQGGDGPRPILRLTHW